MSDLARQAAEHLTRIVWGDFPDPEEGVADVIRSHGTLVSHEDAAWLKLARCPDPLTLDAAVKVMGREPDETESSAYRSRYDWGDAFSFRVANSNHPNWLRCGGNEYWHPTIGQFACLVAAAKQGEQA